MLGIEPVVCSSEFEPGDAEVVRVLGAISLSVLLLVLGGWLEPWSVF